MDRERYESLLDAVAGRPDVLISFDDGNRSDVEVALPALRERGLSARFFVVADRLDRPGYLARDDVRGLVEAGMRIGSHGLRHTSWRRLADAELTEQLETARAALEDAAGARVSEASCPFGDYDRRVLRRLRQLGHERVYTSDGGTTRPDAWLQARNTVTAAGEDAAALLERGEPARDRLVRTAKRTAKRLR